MSGSHDAERGARRPSFTARPPKRLPGHRVGHHRRGLRRRTIYLGVLEALGRTFDAALVIRRARQGPWRAEVAEESMVPALLPGDWLLLDPTCRRWPRPGSIVVVREPGTGILAIKRVAARGRSGGRVDGSGGRAGGASTPDTPRDAMPPTLPAGADAILAPREGWVLGDSADGSVDSRRYGPVDADDLVARAWFRYGPLRRIGRLR